MGGLGSGRWGWHNKKTCVESCRRMTIKDVINDLGELDTTQAVRIAYETNNERGDPEKLDYPIRLTWTPTPWGARRYWLICPVVINGRPCGRRAATLYLPPGGRYFGCRHCYDLTYKSSQTAHYGDSIYRMFARYSGKSLEEGREMAECLEYERTGKMTPWLERRMVQKALEYLLHFDPYADYLTPAELCDQSGLSPDSLAALESARLLLPDHGGRYRPKLAGWGRKLAYLLGEGWTLDELKAWARGRWATSNPREWPPNRAAWGLEL